MRTPSAANQLRWREGSVESPRNIRKAPGRSLRINVGEEAGTPGGALGRTPGLTLGGTPGRIQARPALEEEGLAARLRAARRIDRQGRR